MRLRDAYVSCLRVMALWNACEYEALFWHSQAQVSSSQDVLILAFVSQTIMGFSWAVHSSRGDEIFRRASAGRVTLVTLRALQRGDRLEVAARFRVRDAWFELILRG